MFVEWVKSVLLLEHECFNALSTFTGYSRLSKLFCNKDLILQDLQFNSRFQDFFLDFFFQIAQDTSRSHFWNTSRSYFWDSSRIVSEIPSGRPSEITPETVSKIPPKAFPRFLQEFIPVFFLRFLLLELLLEFLVRFLHEFLLGSTGRSGILSRIWDSG